jgi:hypothetical protein
MSPTVHSVDIFQQSWFYQTEAWQGDIISKCMRIGGAKHDNMANKLFDFALLGRVVLQCWFCPAWKSGIAVDGQMVKMKSDEIALKMCIDFKYTN